MGDLIVCTRNDHSVDAAEGKTLANMHVLRIESIIPVGPVVRRMLEADPRTQAPRWTEQAFLFSGYQTAELAYARALKAIRAARAPPGRGRGNWQATAAPGADGALVTVDIDATIVTACSEKEHARPTWKKTYGHHPLTAFADHGAEGTGEALAVLLRAGIAGSNTQPTTSKPPASHWRSCPAACGGECWSAPTPAAARMSS